MATIKSQNSESEDKRKSELIRQISIVSDRYGDKLLDFMSKYGLRGLAEAETWMLEDYVKLMEGRKRGAYEPERGKEC